MPRKKTTKLPVPQTEHGKFYVPSDAEWGGFINIRLEDEDKAKFDLWWSEHRTDAWSAFDDMLGEGMKVSLAYDAENECYICSLTGNGWKDSVKRWCMTTRAGTMDEVIALAMWKHYVLSDGDWGDYAPKTGRKKSWG